MNSTTPKKWSDLEKWISGTMLGSRKVALTITGIEMVEVHPTKSQITQAPALAFRETSKRLILSPTNCRKLSGLFGDDVNACVGQRVTLEAVSMRVAGRDTLPVRISQAPAKSATVAPGTVDAQTGEIGDDDNTPEPAGEDAAPEPVASTAKPADAPASELDAYFPRKQTPAPATLTPGAARTTFYALSGEAIRTGKLTAQAVNDLVKQANGDGFAAALELLEAKLRPAQ